MREEKWGVWEVKMGVWEVLSEDEDDPLWKKLWPCAIDLQHDSTALIRRSFSLTKRRVVKAGSCIKEWDFLGSMWQGAASRQSRPLDLKVYWIVGHLSNLSVQFLQEQHCRSGYTYYRALRSLWPDGCPTVTSILYGCIACSGPQMAAAHK